MAYPSTPDGRYFVVRGRYWRRTNPALADHERARLVGELMAACRAVSVCVRTSDAEAEASARHAVDTAKRALGERGPVWWSDGAADLSRKAIVNTPYADWYASLAAMPS